MKNLFSFDGTLFFVLSRIADLLLLNLLWLLFSFPIFTAGASTTALYSVTMQMVQNKESYIIKSFVAEFKKHFFKSTIVWMVLLLFSAFLYVDWHILSLSDSLVEQIIKYPITLGVFLLLIVGSNIFPLITKINCTVKRLFRTSLLLGLGRLHFSILIIVITIFPVVLFLFSPVFINLVLLFYLFIGVSFLAFLHSFFLNKMFRIFE